MLDYRLSYKTRRSCFFVLRQLNTKQKIGQKGKRGRMNRSTNEGIRRGGWKVAILLIAFVCIMYVLMLFSGSHQGSAVSLKDGVNQMTFDSTERMLAVRANEVSEITSRVVRDGVVNTNNDGSIKVTISLNGLENTIVE
jgi:hypothetical protein